MAEGRSFTIHKLWKYFNVGNALEAAPPTVVGYHRNGARMNVTFQSGYVGIKHDKSLMINCVNFCRNMNNKPLMIGSCEFKASTCRVLNSDSDLLSYDWNL